MRVAISFCQHCSCAGCLRVSLLWGWGWRCCSGCVGVVKTVVKGDSSQNRFKLVYHRKINIGSLGVSQRGLRLYGACLTKVSNYFSSSLSLPVYPFLPQPDFDCQQQETCHKKRYFSVFLCTCRLQGKLQSVAASVKTAMLHATAVHSY